MPATNINSDEVTGLVRRIEVTVMDEELAIALAQEQVGMEITPAWTSPNTWGWEIVFETGDYL